MRPGIACGSISTWRGAWQVSAALPGLLHIVSSCQSKSGTVLTTICLAAAGIAKARLRSLCCVYQGLQLHWAPCLV